jgi:two-component sensor histidine kinase/PAS domain-containing protein
VLPKAVRDKVANQKRRETLAGLQLLDSDGDPDFDRLTRLAAGIFGAPVSLVTLVDIDRQWFKSHTGTEIAETPVELSFCAHAIAEKSDDGMVVLDATADDRFKANVLVTGDEHIRFYAGAPITVHGEKLGTLCVLDRSPRHDVPPQHLEQLRDLAALASSLFELKDEARVRARTTAELIKEEWRHALTLEAGKVGSYVWDITTGSVVANDIMRRMYGFDAVKPLHIDEFFAVMHPDDVPVVQTAVDATFEEGVDYMAEFRVHSGRWLSGRGRVYQRDANGKPLVMMGVNIDITEARQAADHTRHLLRELNHRVKNTLAMTQSLARQTLKQSPDPQAFIDAFSGRLRTLADAHGLLADRDWAGIGMVELVDSQIGPYVIQGEQRLTVMGEDVQLPPDHALGLGIILHELASNAARFGALSADAGKVRIAWTVENGELYLEWIESGGPLVKQTRDVGFGSRLILRSLDKILGSSVSLDFAPGGVEARISFPIS